jgi:hypothetical protein
MNDFQDRLKKANDRSKAHEAAKKDTERAKAAAEQERAENFQKLIIEWNNGIYLWFRSAVSEANEATINSKFKLEIEAESETARPSVRVQGIYRESRGRHLATARKPLPWIEARALHDGDIELTVAYDPMKPQRNKMFAAHFSKEYIEARIADLVDAINP